MTIRDVARLAEVHPGTVSRALNAQTRALVNEETAARVLRAAEELGYRPNPIARGLKTNRSYTIGVVIPDITNPLFPPILRGIEDRLGDAGYTPLIVNTDNDADRERSHIEAMLARQVDGLISATARLDRGCWPRRPRPARRWCSSTAASRTAPRRRSPSTTARGSARGRARCGSATAHRPRRRTAQRLHRSIDVISGSSRRWSAAGLDVAREHISFGAPSPRTRAHAHARSCWAPSRESRRSWPRTTGWRSAATTRWNPEGSLP